MFSRTVLSGRVAIVTGASSGLGVRFAKCLAEHGAAVGLLARRRDRIEALAADIEQGGGKAFALPVDVTDTQSLGDAVERVERALGPVDVLVNNAGLSRDASILDKTEEQYDAVLDTNTKAPYFMAQAVARRMVAAERGGSIVNIGSVVAQRTLGKLSAYAMSKAAVDHMTRCMAREFARHQIRVNALHPGYIVTELNAPFFESEPGRKLVQKLPRRRVGAPEDLDGPLLLLASEAGGFMTGSSLYVDDGQPFGI